MDLKLGDTIKFHAICRWPTRNVTREIKTFHSSGDPEVECYGCTDFRVRRHEISEVNGVPVE